MTSHREMESLPWGTPPVQMFVVYSRVAWRKPQWKGHTSIGHAKNSVKYGNKVVDVLVKSYYDQDTDTVVKEVEQRWQFKGEIWVLNQETMKWESYDWQNQPVKRKS